jgi:hypothetical protein
MKTLLALAMMMAGCGNDTCNCPESSIEGHDDIFYISYVIAQGSEVYDKNSILSAEIVSTIANVAIMVASERGSFDAGKVYALMSAGYPHMEIVEYPGASTEPRVEGHYDPDSLSLWAYAEPKRYDSILLAHEFCHFLADVNNLQENHPEEYYGDGGIMEEVNSRLIAKEIEFLGSP